MEKRNDSWEWEIFSEKYEKWKDATIRFRNKFEYKENLIDKFI